MHAPISHRWWLVNHVKSHYPQLEKAWKNGGNPTKIGPKVPLWLIQEVKKEPRATVKVSVHDSAIETTKRRGKNDIQKRVPRQKQKKINLYCPQNIFGGKYSVDLRTKLRPFRQDTKTFRNWWNQDFCFLSRKLPLENLWPSVCEHVIQGYSAGQWSKARIVRMFWSGLVKVWT